jgi:hypothetical protein
LQLQRRPSTLVAGILQPLIWLVLFGALFAKAPAGLLPGGVSYGRFLGAGVIVFTAFSAALNAGLPVMFDREFGFLNRLLVAPLRSRFSIVLASVLYITSLSLVQSLAIMGAAWALGYGWPGGAGLLVVLGTPSTTSTVGGSAWYYISQRSSQTLAFQRRSIVEQRIFAVYFDKKKKVERIANYGLQDGQVFDFVARTTPTAGAESSFLANAMKNLLRF